MQKPLRKFDNHDNITNEFFINIGQYIKSIQLESGAIPSDEDKNHDPWDHIESIMGLNFVKEIDSSKLAFQWLIDNQNSDGSWFAKYDDNKSLQKNKPTHFGPYISVAALHFYKTFANKEYLEELWPTIKSAINFSINLQTANGTIPWSIDSNGIIEKDYLLTGSSSILKSIECAIAISKILDKSNDIEKWKQSYKYLAYAIKNPENKFDLLKDRKRFSMDWYYPIISGCLNDNENFFYVNQVFEKFYVKDIGVKCVVEEPWVTVAETCEFIISLIIVGRRKDAERLLMDVLNISDQSGIPYMGWQYDENIFWPNERPSWTSSALIIAADSVFNFSKASDLFIANQSTLY
tara:strand:+ start:8853 stop:9902 length:1050 start_codon:yes stop_codon:yes gene_type:complete